jgi:hypothetical protein
MTTTKPVGQAHTQAIIPLKTAKNYHWNRALPWPKTGAVRHKRLPLKGFFHV